MDSPQKKVGSMDGINTPRLLPVTMAKKTPRLLPVTMAKKTPRLLPVTVAKKTPRPDVVLAASAWALFTACVFALSFAVGSAIAYALYLFHVPCSQTSLFLRCDQLTDAEEAVVNALGIGMMCCAALQVAAAVVVLRLSCCRRRRALAYLALVLTIVGHCILAAIVHILLVADPGDLFFGITFAVDIVLLATGDIIHFLALLLVGEE